MNQKRFSPIVVVSIIIGVLAVAGGVWYWQNYKKSGEPSPAFPFNGLKTGLPSEIESLPDFTNFLKENVNFLPFSLKSKSKLDLLPNLAEGKDREHFFDSLNNPKFLTTNPKYSDDRRYALEKVDAEDEPDSYVHLWDLRDKKVCNVGFCGTPCKFTGVAWITNKKFIMWGETLGGENQDTCCQKFISLINLEELTESYYISRLIDVESQQISSEDMLRELKQLDPDKME